VRCAGLLTSFRPPHRDSFHSFTEDLCIDPFIHCPVISHTLPASLACFYCRPMFVIYPFRPPDSSRHTTSFMHCFRRYYLQSIVQPPSLSQPLFPSHLVSFIFSPRERDPSIETEGKDWRQKYLFPEEHPSPRPFKPPRRHGSRVLSERRRRIRDSYHESRSEATRI
jgi:hypothetical protein